MADKKAELAMKKAEELDKELDEHIEFLKKKCGGKKRETGFTEENWEQEIEKVPALMTRAPTQEEIDNNVALSALQALKYEDEDPIGKTEAYKEDGNYEYKKKQFHKAIAAYTEGIKVKCDNVELNAILYTNRATAHFSLGNNRSALNDATVAWKLQPTYMKAIVRGASACVELKNYEEALKWCERGLAIEPKNAKLLELRAKSITEQKRVSRDRRKALLKEKKGKALAETLLSEVKERGVHLEHDSDLALSVSDGGLDVKVCLDADGILHWPVMFVYPEFNETDFISSFCENDGLSDHLYAMFDAESPSWDTERKYQVASIEIYFEDASCEKLCLVQNSSRLGDVLSDSRLLVKQRTPSFIILSKKSSFRTSFLQRYTVEL
ncbi:Tetratricopeptide repeat protein 4 [Acropora cervicornis]|uniref:Tetratricopeptide repeat protein 4 n=1 Tax=Acropora cervicornis TaxID=6130 RepID=A0AAD9Q670_ACRCE|nr:Tetratricopeptide repeat protein 4 [Acropora cervicornis]